MRRLLLLVLLVPQQVLAQCDVSIIGVDVNTHEVTVEVLNSIGCIANGPGGANGSVTMLQIGYHLPEPINSDNELIEDFNETFGLPPCSPQWDANGYYLGMNPNSIHPGWWYSPSTSVSFQEDIMGDGLVTGDIVTIPLDPPGDYENYPAPLAECGDDLIDYWLSEGECIEFVVWQINYGATWYQNNGGWADGDGPGTYQDPNCNNSWYLCRDENPGPAVANPDFCEVILDECNDPVACNYNLNWTEPGGFCIYCDTPNGEELCEEYQNLDDYWEFYFDLFDCCLPPDTIYVEITDTVYVELPPDTVYIVELDTTVVFEYDTTYITLYDTTYVQLPADTVEVVVTETVVQYDTTYIELPADTVLEYITTIDTLIQYEYVDVVDTVFEYSYDLVEIDCESGYPCDEIPWACPIYIPNAFTPNNDGTNDVWGAETDSECWLTWSLRVYSRSGSLIWESADPNDIWLGGDEYYVPSDVYPYQLACTMLGEAYTINGYVTVVR